MSRIVMMVVRRGGAEVSVPAAEVEVADTVLDEESGHFTRLNFGYDPQKCASLSEGTVVEFQEQRWRIEEGWLMPLSDPTKPYGPVVVEGGQPIQEDMMVRVLRKRPVSRITGQAGQGSRS